ncbi:MAG: hypothetical protein LBM64_01830 [Deltaproteobacteria bacterium]|jgi:hypothetical protein|nr:hypothetical protein [Deltaproteobacteria bacterium]
MNEFIAKLSQALSLSPLLDAPKDGRKNYDPELLYVECRHCGKPIVWEAGRTTALLLRSRVRPEFVDEHCLILSDGCRECMPQADGYPLSIVRLAGVNPQDLLLLHHKPGGNA